MKIGSWADENIRKFLIDKHLRKNQIKGILLDLGCGEKPYKKIYERYFKSSFGLDHPHCLHNKSYIDVFGNAMMIPFKNETFSAIVCTEVLEHVENPSSALSEIQRILKKEGLLIMTTPFLVPLHESPYDYYRFTPFSLEMLIKNAGLNIKEIIPIGDIFLVSLYFTNQIFLKICRKISKILRLKFLYSIWNPFIFLFSFLPQCVYFFLAKNILLNNKQFVFGNIYKKLDYSCKGFFVLANKS